MPFKKEFGYIPSLPNAGSPHQTPASLLIDIHYANLQLLNRWKWDRFIRLCGFMKMTPYELGSIVMLRHAAVEKFKRAGRLNCRNSQATALLLTLLESYVVKGWSDDIVENPFPSLSPNSAG